MSMDVGGAKGGLKADINVTPLVDVMLVLLIIMMLIAPMLQKGVDVKLPQAANTADKPETQEQTVVAIDANKQMYLNGIRIREDELRTQIETLDGERRRRRSSSSRATRTLPTRPSWTRWIGCARRTSRTSGSSPKQDRPGRNREVSDGARAQTLRR